MYNTRSSSGNSHNNQYTRKIETFRQQPPPPPPQKQQPSPQIQQSPPQVQQPPPQIQQPPPQIQQPPPQQQTMSQVTNCVSTPKTANPMKNQQHPMPLQDLPPQLHCPKPEAETQVPTTVVTQSSTVQDHQSGFSRSADLINPYHFWIKGCKYYSWGVSHKRETAKLKICCGVVNSVWLKLLLVANNTYHFHLNIDVMNNLKENTI